MNQRNTVLPTQVAKLTEQQKRDKALEEFKSQDHHSLDIGELEYWSDVTGMPFDWIAQYACYSSFAQNI